MLCNVVSGRLAPREACPTGSESKRERPLRRASLLLALVGVGLAATGCGSTGSDHATHALGGTLRIATAFEPTTLDPTIGHSDVGCANIEPAIFGTLTELRPGSNNIQPGLAASWTKSADGLTYTFHLRKAQFSDGTPVTSADVAFSMHRLLDPKIDPAYTSLFGFIKSVTAPDPSTAVFHLKSQSPALLEFLSFEVPSIVPKAYFQKVGAKAFAAHPIGSGPFKLVSWQRGRQLTLARNPHYWREGLPYLDRAVVRFVTDDNARILLLRSGEIDVDDNVSYAQIDTLDRDPNIKVTPQPVAATFGPIFNQAHKPLSSKAVRQALNHATPKEEIIRVVFGGKARISNSIIPPLAHWSPDVPAYAYDLDKARELMASSPTPDGFSMTIGVLAGDPAAIQTATILQDAWAKIGVKVAIRQKDAGTLYVELGENNVNAELYNPTQWGSDVISEDEVGGGYLGPPSEPYTHYHNAALNKVIDEAKVTVDPQTRRELWVKVQRMSMEDPPWVPIAYPKATPAMRNNVEGFSFLPTVMWRIEQTTVR